MTIVIASRSHVLPLTSSSMTKRIFLTLRRSYTLLLRHPIIPLLTKVPGEAVSPPVTGNAAHAQLRAQPLKLRVTATFLNKLVSVFQQGYAIRMHAGGSIGGEGYIYSFWIGIYSLGEDDKALCGQQHCLQPSTSPGLQVAAQATLERPEALTNPLSRFLLSTNPLLPGVLAGRGPSGPCAAAGPGS